MNLLVSHNWIKDYLKTRRPAEAFAREISLCGPSVERSYPQAPQFDKMVVGQLVAIKPHPNADKLRVVEVDVGKKRLSMVCGGSNLSEGMKVAVALVGAKVLWHGQGEPVTLEPAEIRGVESRGMVCGANEIGLADAFPHADREILDLSWCKARPGTPLAKALGLEDTVFDIEVTTNRPDAFSVVGLAREAAAILGDDFTWKEPVLPSLPKQGEPKELAVKVSDGKLCTRYQAVVMDGICVGPSPWWLKNRLRLAGIRPINNVVDITNYVMLEYGQPMHAFDYDKLAGHRIEVRRAKDQEKIALLDERTVKLDSSMLVIADGERPVAVAGVMGGEGSGVDEKTKTIVFESATFDPVAVRKTARALNTHSDSSLRFEKGLPEEQTAAALARAVELCQEVACGRLASRPFDVRSAPARKVKYSFRPAKAEALIGVRLPKPKMVKILKSLGFTVSAPSGRAEKTRYEVTVPFWRERDIEGERDLTEEIARVYGYHNLPAEIPAGELPLEPPDRLIQVEEASRQFLRGAGFTETLNYSLVSEDLLKRCRFDPKRSPRLANPLTVDFEYLRPCLVPGLLQMVRENQGLFPSGRLFEVSRVYLKNKGAELPDEPTRLAAVIYGDQDVEQQFRELKGIINAWCDRLGFSRPIMERTVPDRELWHPGRTVALKFGGQRLGWLGEIHPLVRENLGLDSPVTVADVDLTGMLVMAPRVHRQYQPPPEFPPVRRDLAFVVNESVEFRRVAESILAGREAVRGVKWAQEPALFDIYRSPDLGAGKKSLAVSLRFFADDRTLTAEEADQVVEAIKRGLSEKFGAELRG